MTTATAPATRIEARIIREEYPESPLDNESMAATFALNSETRDGRSHVLTRVKSNRSQVSTNGRPHDFFRGERLAVLVPFSFDCYGAITFDEKQGERRGPVDVTAWDADGFAFITRKTFAKDWRPYYPTRAEAEARALACVLAELDTLAKWAEGDVYGYIIEEVTPCTCSEGGHHEHREDVDSCFGFYGLDLDANGMIDNAGEEYRDALTAALEALR